MLNRFAGVNNRRLRIDAFKAQKLVEGNQQLAEKLADIAELVTVPMGTTIIRQDDHTNDIFLFSWAHFR